MTPKAMLELADEFDKSTLEKGYVLVNDVLAVKISNALRSSQNGERERVIEEALTAFVNAWDYNISGWNHTSLYAALDKARAALSSTPTDKL